MNGITPVTAEILADLPKPKPAKKKPKAAKPKAKKAPKKKAAKNKAKPKAKKPTTKKKAAPKSKPKAKKAAAVVSRPARLDLRLTAAEKAKLVAKAAKLRRTVTSIVLEMIEKIK